MKFSNEAMKYLKKMDKIPDWHKLPDEDERIVKLRLLFGGKVETTKRNDGIIYEVYRGENFLVRGNADECAEFLGRTRRAIQQMSTPANKKMAEKSGKRLVAFKVNTKINNKG